MADGLLQGEVAVVTGAAQGNGRAIALGLARAGATVAVADLNAAGASRTATEIDALCAADGRSGGAASFATELDVADREACRRFADAVQARLGPAAVLVNNAGIIRRTAFDAEPFREDWAATFRVNVDGCANMVDAFLPQLRRTGGRIVNLGSILSFVAARNSASYAASKGAVLQLTKALAAELAADGIRVNGIAPGVIATPMTEATRADPAALARFMNHTPMGRVGEPDELVGPVLFLASRLSSYVTGVMLPVDGGYLAV
jgi:NAD(P)-dependent dehydrogenase (short-subunit alcohol dehydrogenase family)